MRPGPEAANRLCERLEERADDPGEQGEGEEDDDGRKARTGECREDLAQSALGRVR